MSHIGLLITIGNMPGTATSRSNAKFCNRPVRTALNRFRPLRSDLHRGVFGLLGHRYFFPVFWREARLDHAADLILDGEQFKREMPQIPPADADSAERTWAPPEARISAAIIPLRLTEKDRKAEGTKSLASTRLNQCSPEQLPERVNDFETAGI